VRSRGFVTGHPADPRRDDISRMILVKIFPRVERTLLVLD
jgi:hypothetical protein